jgi:hypothetical protein
VLSQLIVRIKYYLFLGLIWSVAGEWIIISLYAAVIALLIPVLLGTLLAKKYGQGTILFVMGMMYITFQILLDVNSKVSDHIGYTFWFFVYKALIPFLFTVVSPLWFLRARSAINRIRGLLALVGLTVLLDLLVVGFSYAGELPLIIWMSFIPYTISVLLAWGMAFLLFKGSENPQPVSAQSKACGRTA